MSEYAKKIIDQLLGNISDQDKQVKFQTQADREIKLLQKDIDERKALFFALANYHTLKS